MSSNDYKINLIKKDSDVAFRDECMEELMNYCDSGPVDDTGTNAKDGTDIQEHKADFECDSDSDIIVIDLSKSPGAKEQEIDSAKEPSTKRSQLDHFTDEGIEGKRKKIHHKFVIVGDSRMEGIAGSWKFSKGAQTVKVDIQAFCKIGATCDSLEELLAHKNLHEADALFICLLHCDITTGVIGEYEVNKRLTLAKQLILAHKYLSWMDYLMSRFPQLVVIFMMPPIFDFTRYNGKDNSKFRKDTQNYVEIKTRIKHYLQAAYSLPVISMEQMFSYKPTQSEFAAEHPDIQAVFSHKALAIPFNKYSTDGLHLHHVGCSKIVKNLPSIYDTVVRIQNILSVKQSPRIRVDSYEKFPVSLPDELTSTIFSNVTLPTKTLAAITPKRDKEIMREMDLLHNIVSIEQNPKNIRKSRQRRNLAQRNKFNKLKHQILTQSCNY